LPSLSRATSNKPLPARPPNPLRLRRSPRLRLPRRRQAQHRPHVRPNLPICAILSSAMRIVLT